MALLAAGSLQNIYASLDYYLTTQLVTAAGLTLRLHGVRRFIPPIDDPWVEAHYDFLGLTQQFLRQISGTYPQARFSGYDDQVYGTERRGQLQLNIFQRARDFTARYTTAATRDIVVAAFPDGLIIPVFNFTAGVPDTTGVDIGNIIADGVTDQVIDTGLRSGVTQHVVQISTRYIEHYTR